jgi:vitamin B12 transporter
MRLRSRSVFSIPFLLLTFLILPAVSFGQTSASIRGTITDPTGGAVAGASVSAWANDNAKPIAAAQTGDDGTFSMSVAPGHYRLTISAANFAPDTASDVAAMSGPPTTLDVKLQLAPMSSNVVISAEAQPRLASDVVAPVDVITRQDIDDEQQPWLTPMLATVPGISFSQLGAEGGTVSIFLDGGNSNYTKVLVDGVPADVSLPGISFDPSAYTTDGIDKIEVVHGASSVLYGSDAMTGAIDILTHRGTTATPELVLQGDGGTFDTGRGSGQLSGALGRFDYSVAAGYFSTRGQSPGTYVLENDGPLTYPFLRDTTLSGNFGWKFSDSNTLRLTLRNNTSDAGDPGQTLLASNPTDEFNPVEAGVDTGEHEFTSGLSWDFSTGQHWQNHVQGFDSRTQIAIPAFETLDKFNAAGLDARTTYLFKGGAITAGYYFENETGGVLGRHDNAGYLEARYQFTRRLTAVAGGRVEANDSYGTRFVPRVGANYTARYGSGLWGNTRLLASFGQGIKEPPLFPEGCTPDLKPEQSTTFDAGFDQDFDSGRARLSATFFHNDFHNIVSFASGEMPNGMPQNCSPFFGSYFNTDKARAYGTDSSFTVRLARWIDVRGTYSYDDSRVLDSPNASDPALVPGNRLLKRPLNSADLMVNLHHRGIRWNITGYLVGRRTDSDFLSETEDGVCQSGPCIKSDPGYVRWDTSAVVPLRYGLSLTAHFQNVFDKHYSDAVGYPALGYNYLVGIRCVFGGDH